MLVMTSSSETALQKFKDILEPRRKELSNIFYFLRDHYAKVAHEQNHKPNAEQHKIDILGNAKVQKLIKQLMEYHQLTEKESKAYIRAILDEIGHKMNLDVIRMLGIVLTKISLRIYTAINVNESQLLKIKNEMGSIPMVLVPSHRSYGDFILMSYLLYTYNIAIPTTAAGMDFHGMKIVGEMLRNTGAFFMRRSYGEDQTYWDIFRQYIHQLVTKNDAPIQFFVEGTRSRSMKSLVPKFGLLFMTLKPFFTAEVPDIMFVPVNTTYDRVLEEALFAYEHLGVPKPKESTSGFLKSLKIVNDTYGKVYINFGEPISAKLWFAGKYDPLEHNLKSLHSQELTQAEKVAVSQFAQEIIYTQQKLCIISTFNLIALSLTYHLTEMTTLHMENLLEDVLWYKSVLETFGAITDVSDVEQSVYESLRVHRNLVTVDSEKCIKLITDKITLDNFEKSKLKGHDLSEKTMTTAVPHIMLQLYVNPVLHYLVNPMIFALVLSRSHIMDRDDFIHEFEYLRSLFSYEFLLCSGLKELELDQTLKQSVQLNIIELSENSINEGSNQKLIQTLCNLMKPFVLCYYMMMLIFLENSKEFLSEKTVFSKSQAQIEILLNRSGVFVHPYSLSLDSLKNCLNSLVAKGGIRKNTTNKEEIQYIANLEVLFSIAHELRKFVDTVIDFPVDLELKNKL